MSPTPTPTSWVPPTPDSILVRLPSPPAPLGAFDPLPPPLAPHDTFASVSTRRLSVANLLNDPTEQYHRATPSSFAERETPVQGFFLAQTSEPRAAVILPPSFLQPPSVPSSQCPGPSSHLSSPQTTTSTTRKRPPRAAAKPLPPRQPSPFSLSPPPSRPSNRKVSHSLIERRRREKINDCLGKLKGMVPQCREEGERKEERARERGRKRGREEGGGGLHKLEILQGTILYIEELEARLASLGSPALSSESPISSSSSSLLHPILPKWTGADEVGVPTDTDSAALLLLKFSTSPELRPVFFAD